jgi:hypothetical protein
MLGCLVGVIFPFLDVFVGYFFCLNNDALKWHAVAGEAVLDVGVFFLVVDDLEVYFEV